MLRMYEKLGIDMRTTPILIYPTLHYQNGGIEISANGMSSVENLFVAGEAVGGVHGRNRLMGNSLLDIIVFGRNAGRNAGEVPQRGAGREAQPGACQKYEQELEASGAATGQNPRCCCPPILTAVK